jgi:hypothetical protein
MPRAELIPPYSRIMTDSAGNLWVEDYENPLVAPGRWTVYAEDGGILARIVLPERFRPFDIGDDWILGRELDDLDVEHLRVYRIVHQKLANGNRMLPRAARQSMRSATIG